MKDLRPLGERGQEGTREVAGVARPVGQGAVGAERGERQGSKECCDLPPLLCNHDDDLLSCLVLKPTPGESPSSYTEPGQTRREITIFGSSERQSIDELRPGFVDED